MPKPDPKVSGTAKVEALIETIEVLASHVNLRFVADQEKVKTFSRCVDANSKAKSVNDPTPSD